MIRLQGGYEEFVGGCARPSIRFSPENRQSKHECRNAIHLVAHSPVTRATHSSAKGWGCGGTGAFVDAVTVAAKE
jgi:hypothetical protein